MIPQFISTIFILKPNSFEEGFEEGISILFITGLIFAFYIFLTYQLFFNTNEIVDKLKLDNGFKEDNFSLSLNFSTTITIALIIIGGLILAGEIPNLCKGLYQYLQNKSIQKYTLNKVDFSYIIFTAVKIILGLLLIGERKRIIEFINQRQKTETDHE